MPMPVVGQQLYLVERRYRSEPLCSFCTVESVARVYFKIKTDPAYIGERNRFRIADWQHDVKYSSDYTLYASKQEYDDSVEKLELDSEFRRVFSYVSGFPLEKLRRIKAIIDEPENN